MYSYIYIYIYVYMLYYRYSYFFLDQAPPAVLSARRTANLRTRILDFGGFA